MGFLVAALALGLFVLGASPLPAGAAACSDLSSVLSGTSCTVELTNGNQLGWDGFVDVQVTIDNLTDTLHTHLKFLFISAAVDATAAQTNNIKTIDMLGWQDGTASVNNITPAGMSMVPTGPAAGTNVNRWMVTSTGMTPPQNTSMDGFGSFTKKATTPDGCGIGVSTAQAIACSNMQNMTGFGLGAIDVTLSALITAFPANTPSGGGTASHFAVHLVFNDGCSGFVADGNEPSSSTGPGCAVVPEPGTLALVGSGLVSLGMVVRRRLFNRGGEYA